MKTVPLSSQHLSPLTALVDRHIAAIPPGWVLTEGQVAATLATPAVWGIHYPESAAPMEIETLCVVDGDLLAAARLAYFDDGVANLEWIVAQPFVSQALASLLGEITIRARRFGCRMLNLSRHAFGVGWLGIPLAWPHVIAGLQQAGFIASKQWVLMAGSTHVPAVVRPPDPPDLCLKWANEPVASNWRVEARTRDASVADCDSWLIPAHFEGCPSTLSLRN